MEEVKKIGEYRIIREISRSSVASVYEGHQASLNRQVLIKRLHPELTGDKDTLSRFTREAHALARIKHKNIVHIYDFQTSGDSVHLVTEWIAGGSLADRLRDKGPFTEREVVAIAIDVLAGLDVAHRGGVIHRDIKPSNLLISKSGTIKITDFGLAQFEGSPAVTHQGMVIGTPAYLAPEMIAGQQPDPKCDLFSVGVTLYELLTGKNPFLADTISETLNRVMTHRPEPLQGISSELQQILSRLLEKKPHKRPENAREVLADFERLGEKYGVSRGWMDIEGAQETQGERTAGESGSTPAITPTPWPRPARGWVYAAWAVMVLALAFIFFPPSTWKQAPQTAPETTRQPVEERLTVTPVTPGEETGMGEKQRESSEKPVAEKPPAPPTVGEKTVGPSGTQALPRTKPESAMQRESAAPSGAQNPPVPGREEVAEEGISREDATGKTGALTPEIAGKGYLMLFVDPWANIFYRNRFLVQTPYNRPLEFPAGKVELTLVNPDLNLPPITRTFKIIPGDTVREQVELLSLVGQIGQIISEPWARVYLDGKLIGTTPLSRPVYLPFGKHELRFIHPNLPVRREEIEINPGDPPLSVRVNLRD